ncbi:MAG: PilN domain-containing protein [Candidatus Eiseniibacteriota bacterium]
MRARSLGSVGLVGRHVLAWWAGELAAMAPDWLSRRTQPATRTAILEARGTGFALLLRDRRGETTLTEIGADGRAAEGRDDIVERLIRDREPVRLRIDDHAFLWRQLVLPLDVEATLGRVIEFQVDSLTPFKREDVYIGHRVDRRDFLKGELHISVAVAPRQGIDALLERARLVGLAPDAVEAPAGGVPIVVPLADAGSAAETVAARRSSGLAVVLAGLALLLLGAAVYVPIYRLEQRRDLLKAEIEDAREGALATQRLREKLVGASEAGRFFAERKATGVLAVELLNEATRRIPDSAWLNEFRVDDGTLYVSGYAANASSLLGEIEASPILSDAKFLSPVTREGKNNVERFEISSAVAKEAKR